MQSNPHQSHLNLILSSMALFQNHKNLHLLLCFFLFFSFQSPSSSSFSPIDKYFINCGSSTSTTDDANRVFEGDSNSNHFSHTSSIQLNDQNPLPSSLSLYQTASVFKEPSSSYKFQVNSNGTHVVRLHFSPFSTQEYNLSSAVFDVSVSGVQLLSDFSVANNSSYVKEYFLKVGGDKLEILFSPSSKSPSSSFAFVNAIEVFSAPDELITDSASNIPFGSGDYSGLLERVLGTEYRINVGGHKVTPSNDTVWRTWVPDVENLLLREAAKAVPMNPNIKYGSGVSPEIAPPAVYGTAQEMNRDNTSMAQNFNLTWLFPVSSGHKRLVRLHFCDIVSNGPNQLFINVYIGSSLAYPSLDLSKIKYQVPAAPYYVNFIVDPDNSMHINISVGPTVEGKNAILNGVEIMKVYAVQGLDSKKHSVLLIGLVIGGGLGLICVVVVVCLLVFRFKCMRRQRKPKPRPIDSPMWSPLPLYGESTCSKTTERTKASLNPHKNLGLIMSLAEIQSATGNFDPNSRIGSGGFGNVYKGVLSDGTKVAVKRAKPGGSSGQGLHEFLAEIRVLSSIHHRHLVSLIGYCVQESEMILVYEFVENGSLQNHLYGKDLPCLSWKQRLEICIGSARGIHYLHTFSEQRFIHRDVKSANILLDENYSAKVADFGLSRVTPSPDHSAVSTNVKGSFGYFDPEYFKTRHLTQKSDVYSFGVVLLEVLCARPAIDLSLPRDQVNLAEWALQWQQKGLLMRIIDARLEGTINLNSLRKFGETLEKCLAEYGVDRPTMGDVLWNLEYVLQLQETAMNREPHEDSAASAFETALPEFRRLTSATTTTGSDNLGTTSDVSSLTTASGAFSQLISSEGR